MGRASRLEHRRSSAYRSVLSRIIATGLVACGQDAPAPAAQTSAPPGEASPAAESPLWETVAAVGAVKVVYMAPEVLKDRVHVAQALQELADPGGSVEIHIFDDRAMTLRGYPITDRQTLHWRATYSRNARSGFEEFQWLVVTDSTGSPPEHQVRVDDIRPGFASER